MDEKHNFEIYTSTDKTKRDQLFHALRTEGDAYERQAVKFSGVEPVLDSEGKQTYDGALRKLPDGSVVVKQHPKGRSRPVYRSTWSVAHPKQPV